MNLVVRLPSARHLPHGRGYQVTLSEYSGGIWLTYAVPERGDCVPVAQGPDVSVLLRSAKASGDTRIVLHAQSIRDVAG
jgi:hypothetical protein